VDVPDPAPAGCVCPAYGTDLTDGAGRCQASNRRKCPNGVKNCWSVGANGHEQRVADGPSAGPGCQSLRALPESSSTPPSSRDSSRLGLFPCQGLRHFGLAHAQPHLFGHAHEIGLVPACSSSAGNETRAGARGRFCAAGCSLSSPKSAL
jgi:hypothetical protein